MGNRIRIAIVGLGNRGKDTYAPAAELYADDMEIAAVADIDPNKLAEVARRYSLKAEACFASAEALLEKEQLADAVVIATQDRQHVPHAKAAIKKGYHVLLEKPISSDLQECRELIQLAKKYQRQVIVCHVLRYTPFFNRLKQILDEKRIGEITTVVAMENVGYFHQAHSFVRGNWANSDQTSPMILAKCCHDMDLYLWLTGKRCEALSSFGNTFWFKEENAPKGSTAFCLGGCAAKEDCPYDAEKIYLTNEKTGFLQGNRKWPVNVVVLDPGEESIRKALEEGPYGRCVYRCHNNVVDHQTLNMKMTDGAVISFTMSGFTAITSRQAIVMGTNGEITADMGENRIIVKPFGKPEEVIDIRSEENDLAGHGGGDMRLIREFLDIMQGKTDIGSHITSIEASVESHYCAMAAENSRLQNGKVMLLADYRNQK